MIFPATRRLGAWPATGEHRARETLPMTIQEAIRFYDPFQKFPTNPNDTN